MIVGTWMHHPNRSVRGAHSLELATPMLQSFDTYRIFALFCVRIIENTEPYFRGNLSLASVLIPVQVFYVVLRWYRLCYVLIPHPKTYTYRTEGCFTVILNQTLPKWLDRDRSSSSSSTRWFSRWLKRYTILLWPIYQFYTSQTSTLLSSKCTRRG